MIDRYTLRTRVGPPILAAAPALVLLASSISALESAGIVVGFLLTVATLVVAGLVRGRGLKIQAGLWNEWGGPPTTLLLRWSSDGDRHVVARRHSLLEQLLEEPLPSTGQEREDPRGADRRYEVAVAALRDLTRDQDRFALIAEENREYGFRRNCLGIRSPAILANALCALACLALVLVSDAGRIYLLAAAVALIDLLFWFFIVRTGWVRSAGELYAMRLIEATETLGREMKLGNGQKQPVPQTRRF